MIGRITAAAAIVASAALTEAMAAPSVAITPAGPRAHPQEDAVGEIAWSVITVRRASIRRIVVVAVGTDGLNAQLDDDLRLRCRRKGQPGK